MATIAQPTLQTSITLQQLKARRRETTSTGLRPRRSARESSQEPICQIRTIGPWPGIAISRRQKLPQLTVSTAEAVKQFT